MLTTNYLPGAPNWVDLETPDIEAAAAFYGALFGWEYQPAGPEPHGYGFFQHEGKTVAAVGLLTEEGAASGWTLYFRTNDADATAKAVEQAGGTVRSAPSDVSTEGRMAHFIDPSGARFAVWQPGDITGLDAVTDPNTLCWTELYTSDAGRAKDFYRSVLDWTLEDMPLPDGTTYTVAGPSGAGEEALHAGIMQLPPENLEAGIASAWHPYFEVTGCDTAVDTATEHGATAIIPAMDMEGVGRFAMLVDPFGATFAVITSSEG